MAPSEAGLLICLQCALCIWWNERRYIATIIFLHYNTAEISYEHAAGSQATMPWRHKQVFDKRFLKRGVDIGNDKPNQLSAVFGNGNNNIGAIYSGCQNWLWPKFNRLFIYLKF